MTQQQARELKLKNQLNNILYETEADIVLRLLNRYIREYQIGDITAQEFLKLINKLKG